MPCYKPLRAWRTDDNQIVFAERGRIHSEITLACGQCIGCRLERSRQWATRCIHEAKMHKHNCFVTLTYSNEQITENKNLQYRDFQLFMKRLRKKALSRRGVNVTPALITDNSATEHTRTIRFYMAGEYGTQYGRPHFHACLFGINFQDKIYLTKTPSGSKIYRSSTLEKIWTKGFSSIGDLTFESAAYTARYIMKKITGQQQKQHYMKTNPDTGEIYKQQPEFNHMSRRPGIGQSWLQKYQTDVYPHATVIVRGVPTNPPRYYDKQYKKTNPTQWEAIEYDRYLEGKKHYQDQTAQRLIAKETVTAAKIKLLKRKL